MENLLSIKKLQVTSYQGLEKKPVQIIKGVDLNIKKGEILGIVGESGSGKSILMRTLKNILPADFQFQYESFTFAEKSVKITADLSMAMIFQDPKKALNPVRTIGGQLIEVCRRFQKSSKPEAKKIVIETLEKVSIPDPEARLKQYPHELSGGLLQRVMIGMALLTKAQLLIADEPTTALDAATQKNILLLLQQLQRTEDLTIILISHDLQVIKQVANRVAVMYFGEIVELAELSEILTIPRHPYTRALLKAMPAQQESRRLESIPGSVPTATENFVGCFFAPRCSVKLTKCEAQHPELTGTAHQVRCFNPEEGRL